MGTKKPTTLQVEIYSEATLRPLDLCSAMVPHLSALHLKRTERATVRRVCAIVNRELTKPYTERDGYAEKFVDAWESIVYIIDGHCPDGCYFGSSEGDGACIGVWPFDEDLYED